MPNGPKFEFAMGSCDVPRCANPAKYRARWPHASKLVCENHKTDVDGRTWFEVAQLFGSNPPN
jgi:hypothetical protein